MCAIVDADVVHQLVGPKQTDAGKRFREWLDSGRGELVVGGKNTIELTHNKNFERWFVEARRLGRRVRQIRESMIKEVEDQLSGQLTSNDLHVVALAVVSGARLLFTDDRRLRNDFRNPDVISGPDGRVYTTRGNVERRFTTEHRELLESDSLCGGIGVC